MMDCLSCDGEMDPLWTVDIDHGGQEIGWSREWVCEDCTPDYYRRFA